MNKVRLTEADLTRLVRRVIQEQSAVGKSVGSAISNSNQQQSVVGKSVGRAISNPKTSVKPGSRPQSSGPRNITLTLDCGKKTLTNVPMTTQQISAWCKPRTPQRNTPASSPSSGGAM